MDFDLKAREVCDDLDIPDVNRQPILAALKNAYSAGLSEREKLEAVVLATWAERLRDIGKSALNGTQAMRDKRKVLEFVAGLMDRDRAALEAGKEEGR